MSAVCSSLRFSQKYTQITVKYSCRELISIQCFIRHIYMSHIHTHPFHFLTPVLYELPERNKVMFTKGFFCTKSP